MLRPEGRLFLRACLRSAGVRNAIDRETVRRTFAGWRFLQLHEAAILSDIRSMPAFVCLLER